MKDWQFCKGCARKQPIPGCPLCERENGRAMTQEELARLAEGNRLDNEKAWPLDIMDIPFEDGTMPRERQQLLSEE